MTEAVQSSQTTASREELSEMKLQLLLTVIKMMMMMMMKVFGVFTDVFHLIAVRGLCFITRLISPFPPRRTSEKILHGCPVRRRETRDAWLPSETWTRVCMCVS